MPVHVFPTFVMPMHVPDVRFRQFAELHCLFCRVVSSTAMRIQD